MKKLEFIHPKFIPTWIGILLMRIIIFIPFKLQVIISKLIAYPLIPLFYKKYKIAKINISKCFPNLATKEQNKIIRQHFADMVMSIFETAMCFYASKKRLNKLYVMDNKDLVQSLFDNNEKIILLAGHFTPLLLTGRFIADNFADAASIYRPQNNKLFNRELVNGFIRHGAKMVDVRNSRKVVQTLRNGTAIWYAPDQDLGGKNTVFAPFFGVMANTLTSTAKLAKITNAKVIAFNCYRYNKGYSCNFEMVQNFPVGDDVLDATTINKVIENQVKLAPSQYLWTHRRFKTRPVGEKSFY